MEILIPGHGELKLKHLVMDYNGTLAIDGRLIEGVSKALNRLSEALSLHVLTADTFGIAKEELEGVACEVTILPGAEQQEGKLQFIKTLGAGQTVAIGNGRNDQLMLREAALGIAVILKEGACTETVTAADVVCPTIESALELLLNPLRLTATLRS